MIICKYLFNLSLGIVCS